MEWRIRCRGEEPRHKSSTPADLLVLARRQAACRDSDPNKSVMRGWSGTRVGGCTMIDPRNFRARGVTFCSRMWAAEAPLCVTRARIYPSGQGQGRAQGSGLRLRAGQICRAMDATLAALRFIRNGARFCSAFCEQLLKCFSPPAAAQDMFWWARVSGKRPGLLHQEASERAMDGCREGGREGGTGSGNPNTLKFEMNKSRRKVYATSVRFCLNHDDNRRK